MTDTKADPLTQVFSRFKHTIIGSDLYIGVEAWPRGAWSVKVPDEGRAIFDAWLSDLEKARAALAAPQPAAPLGGRKKEIARIITEAMVDSWNDICSDTGCHPLDFERLRNRALSFKPAHWSNAVAESSADAILAAIPQERGVDRSAIIEEAARVAESFDISSSGNGLRVGEGEKCIADAIRALGKETGR